MGLRRLLEDSRGVQSVPWSWEIVLAMEEVDSVLQLVVAALGREQMVLVLDLRVSWISAEGAMVHLVWLCLLMRVRVSSTLDYYRLLAWIAQETMKTHSRVYV